jgi:hypothetical protein
MTPHQALGVAVRLFAIWLAIYVAHELLGFYIAGRERADASAVPIIAAISCLMVVFLAILWFFPRTIARRILPASNDTVAPTSSPQIWLSVGSSLIGLWLVASAVAPLLRNLTVMYLFRSESVDMTGLRSGLVYYFIQFIVGLALIAGAEGIKRFLWWARNAGPD